MTEVVDEDACRAYPRDLQGPLRPDQIYAVARRPPNVDQAFQRPFGDLYWKLAGLVHHAQCMLDLEPREVACVRESLERSPKLVAVLETCSSTLRIEYESALSASYSAQNLVARAAFESLTGSRIEDEDHVPTFAELGSVLSRAKISPPALGRIAHALSVIRGWNSPDLFERKSPRHRVVHREHVQCLPISASRVRDLRIRPDTAGDLGVRIWAPMKLSLTVGGPLELGMGTILVQLQDGSAPAQGPIYVSPPREAALPNWPTLSERARRLVREHLMATALVMNALSEGPDPLSEIVSRIDAAAVAVGDHPTSGHGVDIAQREGST